MMRNNKIWSSCVAGLVVIAVMLATVAALWAAAVGTCVQTAYNDFYLEMQWTGDNTGVAPACNSTSAINGQATYIETFPGTPAPTASHAITLKNTKLRDIAGGALTGLSATVSKLQKPLLSDGTRAWVPVNSKILLTVTGNNAANSTEKVRIYYVK